MYSVTTLGGVNDLYRDTIYSANPRRNLTEILHALGEHTGMKTELYQTIDCIDYVTRSLYNL